MATKLEIFQSERFIGKQVLADIEFFDSLIKIDELAAQTSIKIFVTSSARLKDNPGAIPSAIRSNHFVGHAIDMNIMLGERLFNSDDLASSNLNQLPKEILNFVQSIRQDTELRWGGDFDISDPVHIDDGLNINDPQTWDAKFPIIQSELSTLQPRLLFLTQPFMRGNDVLAIQTALIQRGFNIEPDSIFGPNTDAAVKAFQESQNLTVDGIVGSETRKALRL